MKSTILIGVVLIVLGVIALINKSVSYTTKEKVLDLGSVEATATKHKTVPLSPILGVIALVGGTVLVFVGSKNKSA